MSHSDFTAKKERMTRLSLLHVVGFAPRGHSPSKHFDFNAPKLFYFVHEWSRRLNGLNDP
jgi:hypothetical protein